MNDVALRPLNIISLCTGGGGLDRAVELAIPSARPILCVEREAFSVANLVAQMQQRVMAPAPIWSDVRTVPGRRFRGLVDGVIGGIPCQPYSLAGKRLGRSDERDLWAPARRIFVQSGAWFILIENVGGMLSEGGAERVRGDLLRLGCKVEAGLFRASEVGFPHERERLFILGVADRQGVSWDDVRSRKPGPSVQSEELPARGHCRSVADPSGSGLQGGGSAGDRPRQRPAAERGGGALANADESQLRGQPPTGEQLLVQQDDGTGGEPGTLAYPNCLRPAAERGDPGKVGGVQKAQRQSKHGAAVSGRDRLEMVDALSGGRDGRACEPERSAEERAAVEWASQGPLFAPGPGNAAAWAWIARNAPERLPAISRHDLFRIEIGAALAAAHGDPAARPAQAWGDQAPASWLDESGPYGLRPAIVQEIAQSALRRGFDGVASRIDELRMLGNGVVDLAGAYALRTLATDLARRSAGAAELVRMMEHEE